MAIQTGHIGQTGQTGAVGRPATNGVAGSAALIPPTVDPVRAFERGVELTLRALDEQRHTLEAELAQLEGRLRAIAGQRRAVGRALAAFQRALQPPSAGPKAAGPKARVATITDRAVAFATEHGGTLDQSAFCQALVAAGRYRSPEKARASVSQLLREAPQLQRTGPGRYRLAPARAEEG